jgi:hypothetical protein
VNAKTITRVLFWALVLFSAVSLIFAPFDSIWERLISVLPWLGIGVIVSEALFIGGIVIMATPLGIRVRNPFKLHKDLKAILLASTNTTTFWVGFWINAVGACATTFLLAVGIVAVLPVTSWGLLCLAAVDLAATIAIRQWALQAHERGRD